MAVKISIVVPTYKRPQLLKRCLDSLILQDFSPEEYEIIVITDGVDEETENSVRECKANKYFSNIFCYALPLKKGPAAARNAGWRIARGKWILFTDDDCIASIDWVKNFCNAFEYYSQSFIAFTGRVIVPRSARPTDFELNLANLETADFVTANCACSKISLEKVNGFDEQFTMAWREDSDLHFKLLTEKIPIIKIEEAVIFHPVRKAKWGVSLKEQKKSMFNALLFKKHPVLYKEKISSSILWNYYLMIFLLPGSFIALYFNQKILAALFLSGWFILLSRFIFKRLENASRSLVHVSEMVATSILIPFLSVYWNLYGAYKFKVLHL
jgi:glycosyltransferase involved in cell wall biosynthesis